MFLKRLEEWADRNDSLLCVGLDPDPGKMPERTRTGELPLFEFNRAVIDATCDLVCCYKPQIAYYAGRGAERELKMTIEHIRRRRPGLPVILDAKRADIGSTSEMYAREAFDIYGADAVTVNPYMGMDSLKPFLDRKDKGVVILCRTSNAGGAEIQGLKCGDKFVFEIVAEKAAGPWNYNGNVLLVAGATQPEELAAIRKIAPETTLLVPGVGAQGGDLEKVMENGLRKDGKGLVINSSRGIIHASSGPDFAEAAGAAAQKLRDQTNSLRGRNRTSRSKK